MVTTIATNKEHGTFNLQPSTKYVSVATAQYRKMHLIKPPLFNRKIKEDIYDLVPSIMLPLS